MTTFNLAPLPDHAELTGADTHYPGSDDGFASKVTFSGGYGDPAVAQPMARTSAYNKLAAPLPALDTGIIRSLLQPVVFLRLVADHGDGFPEGTLVAAQYWGSGKVRLTRYPDGKTMVPVAHVIRAVEAWT